MEGDGKARRLATLQAFNNEIQQLSLNVWYMQRPNNHTTPLSRYDPNISP